MVGLTRTAVRQRVASKLAEMPDWSESGVPYDVLLAHAGDTDLYNTFAVKVAATNGGQGRRRADVGVMVNTAVLVRYVRELRGPPDQVPDLDAADDLGHAMLRFLFPAISRSRGLTLVFNAFDVPTIDPASGTWFVGGFSLTAAHRLALE